jgi:class 3 adenylate cyclase/predicted ATPase
MSFLDTIERAKAFLERNGRVSLSALKLEFDLDDARLESLIEELVDVQQVAAREGKVLSWIGTAPAEASAPEPETRATPEASSEPAAAPLAAEAERRQLTVLFCDLVDSTEMASRMDAEDWREVVRHYQETAAAAIESFEGHVAQYLGDGLLVYFGYPRAHEDDAERAVRAALGVMDATEGLNEHLEQDHGVRLGARIGIHTGPVVLGEMGGGERRETLALGETANVAARLQGVAEPGTVVLSAATLRLVQGVFVTRDLGARDLKGLAEPLRIYQAVRSSGMRSRLDIAAATGLTPLVGRDQELGLLEDRFVQAGEDLGQAVLICGEAGIGKSRLMQAFRERMAERPHTWLECRCSPYAQDSALYPVLELLQQSLGFRPGDSPETKLERIEAGLAAADFDLVQAMPLMAAFHALPLPERYEAPVLGPEAQRKRTLELLIEWLLRLGQQQTVVLLMEDLHWMDPSTLELLGGILEQEARARVLLLLTYRPDFEPSWGARSHVTPMLLTRLTRAQLSDLIRKAARERDLPEAWVEEIARRSDGVPLFAEELTRAVLDSNPELPGGGGTPELHIPDTLQDSLMARLDALGPVKELAQLGAVLGREFAYGLLLEVSPLKEARLQEALSQAVREELLYQRGVPPEATYLFKHALIRDAAYQSLLRASRHRHHLRVAETLIDRMPDVVESQPELVAHHLSEAGEPVRAVAYWQRAGERANAHAAYDEAIRHLRHGLELLESLPEDEGREHRELGLQVALAAALVAARGYPHAETRQSWERALALCDPASDPSASAVVNYGLGNTLASLGDPRSALDHYSEALRIGEAIGDEILTIAGHYGRATALYFIGRISESCDHIESAISLYDPARHRFLIPGFSEDAGIGSLCEAGWQLWCGGYPDRAWSAAMRGIELARQGAQPYNLAFALSWGAVTAGYLRDFHQARSLGREAARLSDEQGYPMLAELGRLVENWARGVAERDPGAIEPFLAAMSAAGETGNQGAAPQMLAYLGEIQLRTGRLGEAAATLEGGLALAQHSGELFFDAELHRLKGETFSSTPERADEEAESEFRAALDVARSQGARSFELRAATSLARLWQSQHKRGEARDLLAPVYDWFTEGFDTQDLKDAKALLEELA